MVYENKLGLRFVAFIIDYLCLQILSTFLINLGVGTTLTIFDVDFFVLSYWQLLSLYFVYFVGFALFNHGITVGKMILSLKVVQSDHEPLPQGKLLAREILKIVLMPVSVVSFLVTILRPDNKSIHDLLIDSVVIKEKRYVKNPYNTINDGDAVVHQDNYEEYNTPYPEVKQKAPSKKVYVDPLDETHKVDDNDN